MRRVVYLVSLLIAISCIASAQTVPAKVVDRIVAQVNDDIITLSDVTHELLGVREQLATKYTGDQLEQEMKRAEKAALETLVRDKLFLQKANELGIGTGMDVRVSTYVEAQRKDHNIKDLDEFELILEKQGTTMTAYREDVRKGMIVQDLVGYFVDSRITLLAEEVERFYKDHLKDFSTAEEVTLSEIIIPATGDGSQGQALASGYRDRLMQGESFPALASQVSKGPTASKGGSIGTYQISQLSQQITAAIANVKEGDVSAVTKLPEGYAIFRVDSRKPPVVRPFEEVRNYIKEYLFNLKRQPELDKFVTQLKEDAYIQYFQEIGVGK
ncbi:MAG: peptidyl-prolyl cis-trans isomerase [Acidobacteriota bacterium]